MVDAFGLQALHHAHAHVSGVQPQALRGGVALAIAFGQVQGRLGAQHFA